MSEPMIEDYGRTAGPIQSVIILPACPVKP